MKVIAVLNQKGGSGKTTIATHLARALQLDGADVLEMSIDERARAGLGHAIGTADDGRHLKVGVGSAFRDIERDTAEAEIFEVASFYHHFDVVKEGAEAPAALTIRVCDSLSCMMAGAEDLIARVEALVDPASVRVVRAGAAGGGMA